MRALSFTLNYAYTRPTLFSLQGLFIHTHSLVSSHPLDVCGINIYEHTHPPSIAATVQSEKNSSAEWIYLHNYCPLYIIQQSKRGPVNRWRAFLLFHGCCFLWICLLYVNMCILTCVFSVAVCRQWFDPFLRVIYLLLPAYFWQMWQHVQLHPLLAAGTEWCCIIHYLIRHVFLSSLVLKLRAAGG